MNIVHIYYIADSTHILEYKVNVTIKTKFSILENY